MTTLRQFDGLLTNQEVYDLILESKQRRQNKLLSPALQNRETLEALSLNYLQKTCSAITTDQLKTCITAIKNLNLKLTEAELIQIANHLPRHAVEIHAIVEECYTRLTDDQVENIISIIATYLPSTE